MSNGIPVRRGYINFPDLVAAASERELGLMILSAEYTRAFSIRLRHIINELEGRQRDFASISVMFNTEGEIAIIDEALVGRFVALRYCTVMEEFYKHVPINKVVRMVIEGGEKRIMDFLSISYDVLYDTLEELYKEVRCKKELLSNYKYRYNMEFYSREDAALVTLVLMVIEDIIKYIGIKESYILTLSAQKLRKNFSQHI